MSKLINLGIQRILKRQDSYFSEVRQEALDEIANILATDITKLNGQELRKLRDSLISLQRLVAVSSPEVRKRIGQKHEELGRDELTTEELSECLGPIRTIRFSVA
jgi:hypothetical protein